MKIVPHDQSSFDRRQEHIKLGEDSITSLFHIRKLQYQKLVKDSELNKEL